MDQATQLAIQAIKNRLDQLTESAQVEALLAVIDGMVVDDQVLSSADIYNHMIRDQANG